MSTVGIAHQMAWFDRHPPAESSWDMASYQIQTACSTLDMNVDSPTSTSASGLRVFQQKLNSLDRRRLRQLEFLVLTDSQQGLVGVLALPKNARDRKAEDPMVFCTYSDSAKTAIYGYAQLDEVVEAVSLGRLNEVKTLY